jgi:hypothetical protein
MPYPALADVRDSFSAMGSVDKIPDALIERHLANFRDIAEEYRGVAFEPTRTTTFTHDAQWTSPTRAITLKWAAVSAITAITVDGVAQVVDEDYTVDRGVFGHWTLNRWGGFSGLLSVTYVHGIETPGLIWEADIEYVRAASMRTKSNVPRDLPNQPMNGGTTTYAMPNWAEGAPTGYTEVDRLLNSVTDRRLPGIA